MFPGGKKKSWEISKKHQMSTCLNTCHWTTAPVFTGHIFLRICSLFSATGVMADNDKALANTSKSKVMDTRGNACANSHLS